jgi:hypothetical protein
MRVTLGLFRVPAFSPWPLAGAWLQSDDGDATRMDDALAMTDVVGVERSDLVAGDPAATAWRRAARRHQASWRAAHGWKPGTVSLRNARLVASKVDLTEAERDGANFLTAAAWAAARHRTHITQRQPHETLDARRLFCDLLSSMPMCFNLLGPLWADPALARAVTHRWFPEVCPPDAQVTVAFEWSPGRRDPQYLNDRTAFDAVLFVERGDLRRLIGIETKYHEVAEGPRPAGQALHRRSRAENLTEQLGVLRAGVPLSAVTGTTLEQMWRDHLLAVACAARPHPTAVDGAMYVLLAPAANPTWRPLCDQYASRLSAEPAATFLYRSVDDLITTAADLLEVAPAFRARYLDVDLT